MRTPPSEYARYVEKAQSLLKLDGFNGSLEYLTATKLEAEGQHLVQVILWNNERIRCQVFLTESNCRRVLSPWEKEARSICEFLPKLGWKAPFRITNELDGWAELQGEFINVNLVSAQNEAISVRESLSDHRILSLYSPSQPNGGSYYPYKPRIEELQTADKFFERLEVPKGDQDQPSKMGNSIYFRRSVPEKAHPFEVQLGATLFLDATSLKITNFSAPSKQQLEEASNIPPLNKNYLAVANKLGSEIGRTTGRKFAKAKVYLGSATWDSPTEVEVTGWISKDHKKITALDGVEYPVDQYLSETDVSKAINNPLRMSGNGLTCNIVSSVTPKLLFEAGENQLACRLYHQAATQSQSDLSFGLCMSLSSSYRLLVADNLRRGNFKEAYAWSEKLVSVETLRAKLPIPRLSSASSLQTNKDLVEAIAIKQDLNRRLDHQTSLTNLGDAEKLIAKLEDLTTPQMMQPGGIDFRMDPLVIQLESMHQSAIPALISAIRSDNRYTRAISFFRNFAPMRYFHTTREVEILALKAIWPSSPNPDFSKPEEAAEILSDTWKKESSLTEPERMLVSLQEDDRTLWRTAAGFLVSKNTPDSFRQMHSKEVSELLTRRMHELLPFNQMSTAQLNEVSDVLSMAHLLYKWEGAGSLTELRKMSAEAIKYLNAWKGNETYVVQILDRNFGQVTLDRLALSDDTAINDYRLMLKHTDLDAMTFSYSFWAPLWLQPSNSSFGQLGAEYFQDLSQHLTQQKVNELNFSLLKTTTCGILKISAFRKVLCQAVADDTQFGKLLSNRNGSIVLQSLQNMVSNFEVPKDSPYKLLPGSELNVTNGDYFCRYVSGAIIGAPRFELWAPSEVRAREKKEVVKFLSDDRQDWLSIARKSPYYRGSSD